MTIQFRDFSPAVKKQGWIKNEYATLQETVEQANVWIAEAKVHVLNIETVVLPNIAGRETAAPEIPGRGLGTDWYQVIRIWYET